MRAQIIEQSPLKRSGLYLFAILFAGVLSTGLYLTSRLQGMDDADLLATGLTLDLMLGLPLAWYLLVARPRGLPAATLVPVLIVCFMTAAWLIPDDLEHLLGTIKFLAFPVEAAALGWIGWRATRAVSAARGLPQADPVERLHRAAVELTGSQRAASVLASGLGVFYFALRGRKAGAHTLPGSRAFSHHRLSAHGVILLVLTPVLLVETFAVHFLVSLWSPTVAWVLTLLSLYTGLWLFADYRATVARPILVTGEQLTLRAGLRWSLTIPVSAVKEIVRENPGRPGENIDLPLVASPTHWLVLSQPTEARGPYGIRRLASSVGIHPDDPQGLLEALTAEAQPHGSDR